MRDSAYHRHARSRMGDTFTPDRPVVFVLGTFFGGVVVVACEVLLRNLL